MFDPKDRHTGEASVTRADGLDWLSGRNARRVRQALLHGAAFLMTLLLFAGARGQLMSHPGWTALAMAAFGGAYGMACVILRDPDCVYPALGLLTFAFFLGCYAAGIPTIHNPLIASLLMMALWHGARRAQAYPASQSLAGALHRCVLLTALFFGAWAVITHAAPAPHAAATFLVYGLTFALFNLKAPRSLYAWGAPVALALGVFYTTQALGATQGAEYGVPVMGMTALIFLLAALNLQRGDFKGARAGYLSGVMLAAIGLGIGLAGRYALLDVTAAAAIAFGLARLAIGDTTLGPHEAPPPQRLYAQILDTAGTGTLWAAILLVVLAPVYACGHAGWAALLLSALTLLTLTARLRGWMAGPRSPEAYQAAILMTALGWSVCARLFGPAMAAWGSALVAAVWLALWSFLRPTAHRTLAATIADAGAAIAALTVVRIAELPVSVASLPSAAILGVALLAVARTESRLPPRLGAMLCIPLVLTLIAATPGAMIGPWLVPATLAAASLAAACILIPRADRARVAGAGALAAALLAFAAGLQVTVPHQALLCTAGAAAVPFTVGAIWHRLRRPGWGLLTNLLGLAGITAVLVTFRAQPVAWLGLAFLLWTPFLAGGWWICRQTLYATATAAALALGLLLPTAGMLDSTGALMLVGACLVVLYLSPGLRAAPNHGGLPVVTVGHALAALSLVLFYGILDQPPDPYAAAALALVGATYLAAARRIPGSASTGAFFISLALLPPAAAVMQSVPADALFPYVLLVPGWAILGLLDRKAQLGGACRTASLLALAVSVAGATQGASPTGPLFVCCLAGLLVCLALRKERFYVHLVLLVLALMGYAWIRESASHFTQHLYLYMLLILGLTATAELSPYLLRHVDRAIPLPFIRLFTWRGLGAGMALGIMLSLLCASAFALAVTEHPAFCKSCHNMDDFFASWQHSSHKDVACIECHYEPGVAAHIEGKFGALSQVASFVTHRYGSKPHAEVSNRSCQRSGCHTQITTHTDTLFKNKVHFNHKIHHDAMVPGRDLPCTTCHSQELRSEHIGILSGTCFLCHFHGQGAAARRTDDCTTCHGAPQGTLRLADYSFDHSAFFGDRPDMDCHQCHRTVNAGDARASAVRCQSCHYGTLLTADTNIEALHALHVHDHRIGCFECHGILRHGITTRASKDDPHTCANCHSPAQHTLQTAMLLGRPMLGLESSPNIMFEAGISCTHCHGQAQELVRGGRHFVTHVSRAEHCVTCHGDEDYKEMFESWQSDARDAITSLEVALDRERARYTAVRDTSMPAATRDAVREKLDRAFELLDLVKRDGSYGVHNVDYIDDILSAAKRAVKQAATQLDATEEQP